MNTEKNKRWSWALTLLSLMILSLFVGYWNYQAYSKAKNQLATDIRYELGAAYNEVKDSYIQDDIFLFLNRNNQKDSMTITVTETGEENDPPKNEIFYFEHQKDKFPKKIGDPLDVKRTPRISSSRFKLAQNEKGNLVWVKKDSLAKQERFTFPEKKNKNIFHDFFSSSIDRDQQTYALFDKKLIAKNLPSSYTVVNNDNHHAQGLKIAYESKSFGNNTWEVVMSSYRPYLFKKILPNILFSLFLLSIVGLAFWTLIQNWIQQQQLVKTKSEFINNMTHELKTPLATVGVALEAIADFDPVVDAAKTKEYIDISRNEVNRLSLLVDKVLNIAQFESEDPNLNLETIDLKAIIEKITRTMKVTLNNKGASLNIDTEDNLYLKGDSVHLSNVIYNILDNALKYSPHQPTISISAKKENDRINLSIKDNGSGIAPTHLKYIFDRFYRIPTQDRHNVKGHGLGLSYVKEIVKLHGGSITAKSAVGEGTQFNITLPAVSKTN